MITITNGDFVQEELTMKMLFRNPLCLLQIFVVLSTLLNFSSGFECKHNKTDLSALSGFPWVSWTDDTVDENISYRFSLCSPLMPNGAGDHTCPSGSSVCMIYSNGTSYSAGNFDASADSLPGGTNEELGESWVVLAGDPCPADPKYNLTTSISFKCGPTIGSPVFLDFTTCVSYFEWETNLYCTTRNTVKEVPCYLYDDQGNRYDLSPLAKTKGGYLVSSELDTDIYINVCRDIKADSITSGCPAGSAACRKNNGVFIGLGEPTEILKRGTDGRLTLKYVSPNSEAMAGCTTKPSTTVIFICPERGASKDPLVVKDFDCQYVIEWETEYACPEIKLHNNSCVLTMEDADIDIDLRPLRRPPGSRYKTSWKDPSSSKDTTYDYFLNVCADAGIDCPDEEHKDKIPACQTIQSNADYGRAMGSTDHTRISYADGRLTLTYKGGEKCHHNNFQRQTVINFVCNQTAGDGNPVFENEDECVYLFTWPTRYACLDHPVEESCRVDVGDRKYDLGPLTRRSGINWMALHEQNDLYGRGQYFINICHNILQTGDASRCDPGAAICYREYLSTRNLGRYESKPVVDSKTNNTVIKYTNGDICNGTTKITSTITFICKPGEGDSAPTLIQVSNDKCFYEFEWHTAEACALGHYIGTGCKIYADGLSFDLTPLRKATGSYKVDSASDNNHDYYLNVCGPITDKCQDLGIDNVGICQVPVNQNENSYVTGQAASELRYYDGMINLTYSGGTPYNDDKKTPRRSEIAFICDQDAGKGQPHFIAEAASEHYYGFEWRTSYACPIQAMQCTAADEKLGQEYDISSLTMLGEGNWAIDGSSNTKYYINICQPLNKVPVGNGCDPFAAICRTKFENGQEKIDIPNMGRVDSRLQVVNEGRLKLVYKGGSCNNGTADVPYITNIEFMCRHTTLTSPPSAPLQDGLCEYTVVWDTPAACHLVRDLDTEPCTAKDPNSDYVFNLSPLKRTEDNPYSIKVDGSNYLINICGNISESKCPKSNDQLSGVCVEKDGKKESLAEARTGLDFREVGVMSLVYEGVRLDSGQRVNVKIMFVCAPDKDIGYPTFDHKVDNTYIFHFFTALACTPISTDCFVQDEAGKQYNLRPLIRNNFWTATDMWDDSTEYYINVCAPVQNVPKSECLDGPIGGCQAASNGKSYNIGYIQSKPIAHTDGSLTIHYRNGDICHKGTDRQAHRSTRINFFCSDTEHGPVFESETETCEYVFNWQTPAACPLQSNTGGQCKVVDPLYKYEFDLNVLATSDYHVAVGDEEYIISVCKHLTDTSVCGTDSGAGVCRTKPHDTNFHPVNTGKANDNLTYDGGQLILNYTGGDNNCYTVIRFSCDLKQEGSKGPQFVEKSEQNCHYLFDWPTYHVCPPRKSATCTVQDTNGKSYDLTNLELMNDNYEVTDTVEKKRYLINVCRSLIQKQNATCPYMAAACMVDLDKPESATDKYKSIGEPSGYQMKVENGQVVITYTNGDKCSNGKDNMTTHITFTCDKHALHSSPVGHFMVGECDHHFLWMTASACILEDTSSGGGGKDITCQVKNPATGNVFDLSNLKTTSKGSPWKVTDKNNNLYEFNICGPVTNSKCTDADSSIGVCQSSGMYPNRPKYNAGKAVHDLWFDDGVVVQNLTGGDRCHNGKYERNTIITFVCNGHRGIGRPMFVDETEDCTYYISWHTNLVCEEELKCSVNTDDYRTIDLSPLSQDPDQVVHSTVDGSVFYLSVCSSLTPMTGILCPAGSGACLVKPSDGVNHTSLGKPKLSPTYNTATKDITLMYVNGSKCDTDPTKNFTSRVIFTCLPGPFRSKPVFVRKADCEYIFQWDTYTVCTETTQSEVCGYHDNTGDFYDFKKLQHKEPTEVRVKNETKYLLNMCGPIKSDDTSSCDSHMVCRKEDGVSFGEPSNFKVVKEGQYIKVMYESGGKCKGDTKAQSSIHFVCDRSVGEGVPVVLASMGCSVVFEWATSYVCPTRQNPCSIVLDNHLYDLSILSKIHGAWNVTDSDKNTYWINICTSVGGPNLPAVCDEKVAACRLLKNGGGDVMGSINSQKKIYKNNTSGALVLEYGEGNPCTRNNGRSATTKINFICGSVFGAPEFVESEENKELCIYEFNWKTKFACKVERESMQMSNGELKDKETGLIVDLKPLWNKSFEVDQKLDSGNENVYKILLNGNSTQCKNGVICQIKNKNIYRTLGSFASAKFTEDDWVIEATYTTGEKCAGDESSHNVTSIIQFHCSKTEMKPRLLYSKKDCFFMFIWETNHACLTYKSIVPSGNSANGNQASGTGSSKQLSGKGGVSATTVIGIVATFLGAVVLCILLVVFHKQERRESCFLRMRGLFSRGRPEYSQLPTGTMDDVFGDEEEVVTVQNAAGDDNEEDPIITVTTTPASYHDDSDEDLLA
ncbi:cation-independent mannose-6-phosphate receptor-like isoform X2 [Mercenaria mercenaria]|uniref:cation-independent mannose-6-phosphate receptor-like isoform X2 n=1 Tax=Mercenaria mercenaria TaxID=6596 RepID=UPI00234EC74B|nr:cation-independent mannose-6-phosphate receptor-like isoform X2 [Mercenaria mercenaria]